MESAEVNNPALNNAISSINKRLTNLDREILETNSKIQEIEEKAREYVRAGNRNTAFLVFKRKLMYDKRKQTLLAYKNQTSKLRNVLKTAKNGRLTRKMKSQYLENVEQNINKLEANLREKQANLEKMSQSVLAQPKLNANNSGIKINKNGTLISVKGGRQYRKAKRSFTRRH